MRRGEPLLRRLCLILGAGGVLYAFSERMFWSLWRPDDAPLPVLGGVLLYSFFGYLVLALLQRFRVSDLWGLFLAGAGFGWLGEGVFAMTLFGDASMPFPLTIVWTGLSWHALLSVVIGLYGLRRALQRTAPWPTLALSTVLGFVWGFWAVGWGRETPAIVAPPLLFLSHALAVTAMLALSEIGITIGRPGEFRPSRLGLGLAGAAILAFIALVTIPAVPWSPLVLVPLLALLILLLRRTAARFPQSAILAEMGRPIWPWNLLGLLALPLAATATYATLNGAGLIAPAHQIVAVLSSLAAMILLALSVVKLLSGPHSRAGARQAAPAPVDGP